MHLSMISNKGKTDCKVACEIFIRVMIVQSLIFLKFHPAFLLLHHLQSVQVFFYLKYQKLHLRIVYVLLLYHEFGDDIFLLWNGAFLNLLTVLESWYELMLLLWNLENYKVNKYFFIHQCFIQDSKLQSCSPKLDGQKVRNPNLGLLENVNDSSRTLTPSIILL